MKKILKHTLILFFGAVTLSSCLIDDDEPSAANGQGPLIAGFVDRTQNLSAVADGSEYEFVIKAEVKGPGIRDLSGDVTLSIEADPSSTAIEGTHYRLNSTSFTLNKSENYLQAIPITLITAGIDPPLAVTPVLKLRVSDANGNNVVANGKMIELDFIYQCFADLSGTYLVTNDACMPSFTTTITANPDGSWRIENGDGGFLNNCTANTGLVNWADITELCGEIVPGGNLRFGSANFSGAIGDIVGGTWDADTGVLTMMHTQDFTTNWEGSWTSTYTRQ